MELNQATAPQDAPPAPAPAADVVPYVNSVDATIGQPIVARVQARKQELEDALALVPAEDPRSRGDIERALSTISELLTGDLENVPTVVTSAMNLWLERNKHLAERGPAVASPPVEDPAAAQVSDAVVAPAVEPGTAPSAPPTEDDAMLHAQSA